MKISADFVIDFTNKAFRYRLAHLQGRNELIAKAVGYRSSLPLTVYDTTAGQGREAFLLAALGCEVTLFERHPVIAKALENALSSAAEIPELAPIVARMTFYPLCAIQALSQLSLPAPDVIYCDPMFCPRTKSAAVKKTMQQIHHLVGQDQDAEQLVSLAFEHATTRVVVKRGRKDPPLAAQPSFSIKAKSHRFDIYIVKADDFSARRQTNEAPDMHILVPEGVSECSQQRRKIICEDYTIHY